MIKSGVIQPSESPWSSPVVLVKKEDGTIRFCVDYHNLNLITTRDVYLLPRIDDALTCLAGAAFFSTIDLYKGYWQVPVSDADIRKTAFVTRDGLFEFKRMPFGLSNAPATFQRLMDHVLASHKWLHCLVYLDDVLVFAQDFDTHCERLDLVLTALGSAGLCINAAKCNFGRREVIYLEHKISGEGISPDPEKWAAILEYPSPTNTKEVKQFLGLASYYRKFVHGFSSIASPIIALLKKDLKFSWLEPQKAACKELVAALSSPTTLAHFDETAELSLKTDASYLGLGAVLTQKRDGVEKVVSFLSRRLLANEESWPSNDLECFAVVWAIKILRPYLYGREFTVYSDNVAAVAMLRERDLNGKFARWVMDLSGYSFRIMHCKGPTNVVADALSRAPHSLSYFTPQMMCCSNEDGQVKRQKLIEPCEFCAKGLLFGEGL